MLSRYFSIFIFIISFNYKNVYSTVQKFDSSGIENLAKENTPLTLLLVAPEKCADCSTYETVIHDLDSYLSPSIRFIKFQSNEVPWCKTCKSPSFIIISKDKKVIYQGDVTADDIQSALSLVDTCRLHHLTDQSFEHDTQAATGGTTGDWLVVFDDLSDPGALMINEGLALRLRPSGVNLATISPFNGYLTYKRFQIQNTPAVYLFRRGSMYKYQFEPNNPEALYQFAVKTHKQLPKIKIPREVAWFDVLTDNIVAWMKDYEKVVSFPVIRAIFGAFVIAVLFFLALLFACGMKQKKNEIEEKKKK